jgi:cytochrome P450
MLNPAFGPAAIADPYPTYAALQAAGPLHRSEEFFEGAWLLTRYDDVAAALKDERLSARRTGGWLSHTDADARERLAPFQRLFARALLFADAPDHTRLRQALAPGFRPAAWQGLAQRVMADVDAALDALAPGEPFDFMQVIARPIPAKVVAGLMGLEDDQKTDEFVAWSDDIAAFIGHPCPDLALGQRAQRSAMAMAAVFQRLLVRRRKRGPAAGAADWTDLLLQAEAQGHIHSSEEMLAQCVMLLFAGHETTRHLLGNGLHALMTHPDAWARLQGDPALLPGAVRELLRFDSPVQYTGRRVAQSFSWHGQVLARGDLVIPLIGAANRDPAVYTQPGELRLDRKEAAHVSFGTGVHVCIGAALTYLEAQAVLGALLRRWPRAPRLAGVPERSDNLLYRGFRRLPLQPPGVLT